MRALFLCSACLLFAAGVAAAGSSTLTGVSREMNPALSVNGLFWAQVSDTDPAPERNRVALQEAEIQFTSVVDPFWKANLVLALHPAHAHHAGDEHAESGGLEFDLEEAAIEGRNLPAGFALRLGKFFLPFGKHAPLHTHTFPFAEAPVGVSVFLGEHSLSETGGLLTRSLPLPWYADLQGYVVNGDAEIFDHEHRDPAFGLRWDNLFDLTENATLELGGSWCRGRPGEMWGETAHLDLFGADLTWKWVSGASSQGPALNLGGEVILPTVDLADGDPLGWYLLAQYRFHRNWWLGLSGGQARDLPGEHHQEETAKEEAAARFAGEVVEYKLNFTFVPSEFSAVRAEVGHLDRPGSDDDELRFVLQWNFTIGSHPAHRY